MLLRDAVAKTVAADGRAGFLAYDLGIVVFRLIGDGRYGGERLDLRGADAQARHYRDVIRHLAETSLLLPIRGVPEGAAFQLAGAPQYEAEQLICLLDPYCFLSHLSAMAAYGVTDRIPRTVHVSAPDPKSWRALALRRMQQDLGERVDPYIESGFPALHRHQPTQLLGRPIHYTKSLHWGAFRHLESQRLRVATIGRTFLDMLRDPDLCGGIAHVLTVFEQHARQNLALIVAEVDQHGGAIDRVRAGYVLEERCGLSSPSIGKWRESVKRGGSRKLVGNKPYSSVYSEKWCLSLNAEGI